MRGAIVVVGVLGCIGTPRVGLLPPLNDPTRTRDPDPTRPLVETAPPSWTNEGAKPVAGELGPVGAGVTASALLLWIFGGASPLLGIYGTFDENRLLEPTRTRRRRVTRP